MAMHNDLDKAQHGCDAPGTGWTYLHVLLGTVMPMRANDWVNDFRHDAFRVPLKSSVTSQPPVNYIPVNGAAQLHPDKMLLLPEHRASIAPRLLNPEWEDAMSLSLPAVDDFPREQTR